jgi:hypothetical protein
VWTPKRVLVLLTGFAVFIAGYIAYAYVLGGIDGLPPLPEQYWPEAVNSSEPPPPPVQPPVNAKLRMAFGEGWEASLNSPMRLEVKSKNLVLATRDFFIEDDGRVRLTPFNAAIFGKDKGDGKFPEINTVQSTVAYLRFDRPITNLYDMARHKVVAGELQGDIRIRNNRRTPQGGDDMSLFTEGPMYYQEDKHQIWTPMPVLMLDEQSTPEPTKITAVGMELHLTSENESKPPAAGAPRKAKVQSISGVESIHLLATVEMHLWVDGNSGFLGGPEPGGKGAPAKPQEKPKLVITTAGPFHYFVSQDNDAAPDQATFDIPKQPSKLPEQVIVTRIAGPRDQEKRDQLFCEHLELTFRRKAGAAAGKEGSSAEQLAIRDAHATGRSVELKSDAEVLHAMGNDFFYDARTKESILKGTPEMVALKDGHEIHAQELRMENAGQKELQKAKANGPGRIAMLDAKSGKRTMHARWTKELDFNKEGANDCLTLTGDAAFEDKEQDWQLRADRLKVWLKPADAAAAGAPPQRNKPDHLEATGHVRTDSPDLHIKEPTEHLMIWFKDAPPKPVAAAQSAPAYRRAGLRTVVLVARSTTRHRACRRQGRCRRERQKAADGTERPHRGRLRPPRRRQE